MMSTSFAYEDPLSRTWQQENATTRQKTVQIFKDMGKGMYKSGKGFAKVGALYSGVECIIEGVSVLHFSCGGVGPKLHSHQVSC